MEQPRPNDPNPKATYLPKGEGGISFPVGKTAFLVIDPVNDFLSEGGAAYELTKSSLKLHNMIDHLKQAIVRSFDSVSFTNVYCFGRARLKCLQEFFRSDNGIGDQR